MRVLNGMADRKRKATADGYGRGHAAARGDAGDAGMEHLIPPRVTKPWRRGKEPTDGGDASIGRRQGRFHRQGGGEPSV